MDHGYNAAGKTFKVHLDGYDQRDLLPARDRVTAANYEGACQNELEVPLHGVVLQL